MTEMMTGSATAYARRRDANKGTPLAPALFALGQHEALCRADSQLRQGESPIAFLDDLYVLLPDPTRARATLDLVTGAADRHAGIY